jgi:hypothetical protein
MDWMLMRIRGLPIISTFLLMAASPLMAQLPGDAAPGGENGTDTPTGAVRLLRAQPALDAPVLDGRLDDAAWQRAAVATDFVQYRPQPGEPASQRTEARVLFDANYIYVGIRAWDTAAEQIASQLARRDATGIHSDWVDVTIDSFDDRRTGYRFAVNPHGVKKDVYHFNDTQEDLGWDAVWDVATSIDEEGWSAEFRIPLSQLRYAPDREQRWGLQFGRSIARNDELSLWSPLLPTTTGFVSRAGFLTGLHGLRSPRRLEVLPYVVSSVTRAPPPQSDVPSPFWRATDPYTAVGADVKYGLSSNLTLTGTINPDFGQVEADPSVVNLTAFETFFPERRPFFLEGANLFSFDIGDDNSGEGLFYSRRIGRAPQRTSFDGADHVLNASSARILGAAKLTGRVGGWSLGVFNAVTQAEHASVLANGTIEELPSEPLTSYAVGRIARDFRRGASTLGVTATATNRRIDSDDLLFLRRSAYSAGINGRHRFGPDNRYAISGFLAASTIAGDTLAMQRAQRAPQRYYQRPDAGHVEYDPHRTSLSGISGTFGIDRSGGGNWSGGLGGHFRSPGFDLNDVGFQREGDQAYIYGWYNYGSYEAGRVLRNWRVGLNPNAGWNFDGTRMWTQLNHWGNFNFANFWQVNYSVNNRWAATSVGALRGGPSIRVPGGNNFNLNVNTDRRRPVHGGLWVNGFREQETGSLRLSVGPTLGVRPSPRLDLSLQPIVTWNDHEWQYVAAPEAEISGTKEYIFARLDQTTVAMTTRLNYTFSPTTSLQLYAQPFISAGAYGPFRRVTDPRAREFDRRFTTLADSDLARDDDGRYRALVGSDAVTFDDPDFNVLSLRSNAVLRWEYRPGSTLFVVWSHGREDRLDTGAFDFGRSVDDLRGLRGTNVLLIKASYWLNL